MRNFLIFILLSVSSIPRAQNIDSLYSSLMNYKGERIEDHQTVTAEGDSVHDKCGFGLMADVRIHIDEFSKYQQGIIQQVMARPELSTSIVSPSGIFRIHYDETGVNQPEYNIQDLAEAFDSAYNFEVNILGYPAPPEDGTLGGDDKYDIYVKALYGGTYGATTPESTIGEGKYLSYIEIDNSFGASEGYNSEGIDAARVTAAHEFHHAIQIGNYIYRSDDLFYYELTSTSFEEFVFDHVNDYYSYMYSFFRSPNNKFEDNSGYNLAIWNIFLKERFYSDDPMLGYNIAKRSWEYMVNNRAMVALAKAMNDFGESFHNELNVFGDWLNFTGENRILGEYFEEAENYPAIRSTYSIDLTENQKTISIETEPTSINYLTFYHDDFGITDTVVAVISNSDVYGSLSSNNNVQVEFTLGSGSFDGGISINDKYFSKISAEAIEYIKASYIINNELNFEETVEETVDYPYPQPFNYENNTVLFIPTYSDITNKSELNIYSSDMNLVYSSEENINTNVNMIGWDAKDENGNKLPSGVYVYVTKADGKIKKGKFVVLN